MKRKKLLQHLRTQGCEQLREGSRHSWWHNLKQNKRSAVPRHSEINDMLARKICKNLGVDPPKIDVLIPMQLRTTLDLSSSAAASSA